MTVCVLAVWRGRGDERLAAGGWLANWAFTMLLIRSQEGTTVDVTQWGVFVVDTALLGLLLWLALLSTRYWPLFAAAFQLLGVATHLGRAADTGVSAWAYLTAGLVWSYLSLVTIGYGAWTAPHHDDASTGDEPRR